MDDTLSPLVDAGAVPKSTPSLPLELIHYIIKLGLPPVRFDAFRERYELLRTFSLVSKSWTSLAQAELQRHLYINSRATYEALDVAINAPEETTFSRRVLSIRLGPERRSWLREDLHGLLKGLLSCEEVWACDREGPGTLLIGPLSSASRLKRLHVDVFTPELFPSAATLLSLVELSISDPADIDSTLAFLSQTTFPALRSLAFVIWDGLSLHHVQSINEVLRAVGPLLERLSFTTAPVSDFDLRGLDWECLTSLRSLTFELPVTGYAISILRRLPTKLKTLRLLENDDGGSDGLTEILEECPPAMSALRALTLPSCCTREERVEIERLCARRGTSVDYRDGESGYWNIWENRILYPCSSAVVDQLEEVSLYRSRRLRRTELERIASLLSTIRLVSPLHLHALVQTQFYQPTAMLYTLLLALSLAALGLTRPQQGTDIIGFTLSSAFEAAHLTKRQDATGAIDGLTSLISQAVNAVSSGGQCSSECTPWSNDMRSCAVLRSNEEIGQCACGSQPITDMEPCGACFNAQTDVSNFQDLCSNLTGETGAGGATSLGGSSSTVPFETVDPFASSAASPSTTGTSFALGVGGNSGSTLATALGTASITAGDLGRARTTATPSIPLGGGASPTSSLVNGGTANSPTSTGGVNSGGDSSSSGGVGRLGVSVVGSVLALGVGLVWLA